MAIAPNVVKKLLENKSIEELEAEYEDLKKNFCFDSKEEQIDYDIKHYLKASNRVNNDSRRIALEELLKEKTGKDYSFEDKKFEITLSDIIGFVTNSNVDPFWGKMLTDFFEKLNDIEEKEKKRFLLELVQNEESFNTFLKEAARAQDAKETYEKYKKIARDYCAKNNMIG